MTAILHLSITTPMTLLVNETATCSVRAEDISGSFGILPGHTDFSYRAACLCAVMAHIRQ